MPKHGNRLILVTGATGHQGGAALRKLRDRGFPVRAMTRDPNQAKVRELVGHGTEVVGGDFDDPASLTRALDGAYGAFSVQTAREGAENEVRRGTAMVEAARRAGLGHFVYSSVGSADQHTGIPHFDSKFRIEEHIRGTGIPFTIFRPVFFMENWLGMRQGIEQGRLALPLAPETRLQMIAVDDIGAFAAIAFGKPGSWNGRAVDLAGDELSMTAVAEHLSRVTGRDVPYQQVPWDQWEKMVGPEMTQMWRWFEETGYHVDIPALRQEHAELMGFDRWLSQRWTRSQAA